MADASSFTKMVPGFDFLQSLVKNAGAAIPGIGQWVAPTLDPAELEANPASLSDSFNIAGTIRPPCDP